jgi:peroxiredoxin
LAEFREHYEEFRAIRVDLAAISIDGPEHSETLRALYQIPFPILCDTNAEVTKSWGLFDPLEKGGIGRSAVFVIEPGLRVKYCSVDSTTTRIRSAELLEYLKASQAGAEAAAPARRFIVPKAGEVVRTALPALKRALSRPKKNS